MDRTQVCGTCNPGSIPGESTSTKKSTLRGAFFVRALTATVRWTVASGIEARLS